MASKKQDKTKKTEGKAYFVVHLLDGTTKDFDKKCTSVNYSQGPMIAFCMQSTPKTTSFYRSFQQHRFVRLRR